MPIEEAAALNEQVLRQAALDQEAMMHAAVNIEELGIEVGQHLRLLRVGLSDTETFGNAAQNVMTAYFRAEEDDVMLGWDEVLELRDLPSTPLMATALALALKVMEGLPEGLIESQIEAIVADTAVRAHKHDDDLSAATDLLKAVTQLGYSPLQDVSRHQFLAATIQTLVGRSPQIFQGQKRKWHGSAVPVEV